jgi:glycine cleavage system regulatory protein
MYPSGDVFDAMTTKDCEVVDGPLAASGRSSRGVMLVTLSLPAHATLASAMLVATSIFVEGIRNIS